MPAIEAQHRKTSFNLLPAAALVALIVAADFALGRYWLLLVAPLTIICVAVGQYWQERRWLRQLKPTPDDRPLLRVLGELARTCGIDEVAIFIEKDSSLPAESFACCRQLLGKPYICLAKSALLLFSEAELKVLFAHELAHFQHRHHRQDRWVSLVMLLLALGGVWVALSLTPHRTNTAAGLFAEIIIIVGVLWLFQISARMILFGLSRKQERKAHRWALEATDDPDAFISCFRKIANLSFTFHPLQSWRYRLRRHRELEKIVKMAEEYAKLRGIALGENIQR